MIFFKVDDDYVESKSENKEKNYETTAKSLILSQLSRLDTQLFTGLHCTRVKRTNAKDQRKLKHMMGHL